MPIRRATPTDTTRYWYVMQHHDPSVIEHHLQFENGQRFSQGEPTLLYIIPFKYLPHASVDSDLKDKDELKGNNRRRMKEIEDNNSLRYSLHDFIFIMATENEIEELLYRPWNREGRLHLYHYRTHDGRPIRVKDAEMQPLISLFIEQRQRFSFAPFSEAIASAEHVYIKTGVFRNYKASVMQVHYTQDGIHLTLGIPVFGGEVMLQLDDIPASDILIPGHMQHIFDPAFIRSIEDTLMVILRRRVMHRDTDLTRRDDMQKLNSYAILGYLKFDDTTTHNHFRSLMLLSAALRKDQQTRDTLIPIILKCITDPEAPANDEEAFFLSVLFVATGNVDYCRAARQYCRTHEPTSQSLKDIMPLIKRITLR